MVGTALPHHLSGPDTNLDLEMNPVDHKGVIPHRRQQRWHDRRVPKTVDLPGHAKTHENAYVRIPMQGQTEDGIQSFSQGTHVPR